MKRIDIYTDGACSTDVKIGGWAYVCREYRDSGEPTTFYESGYRLNTTNNRMELLSVLNALKYIVDYENNCKVTIFSDSAYVVNAINMGWLRKWQLNGWMLTSDEKEVKNKNLWKKILSIIEYIEDNCNIYLEFKKVKGHSGDELNELADKLATGEVKKRKK